MRNSAVQPPLGISLNTSHPLVKGLNGCWLLNEGGGQIALNKTTYGQINGSLVNGTTFKHTKNGIGCNFTGSSYLNIGDFSILEPEKITISVWMVCSTDATQYIVSKDNLGGAPAAGRSYTLRVGVTTGFASFIVWKSGTTGVIQGTDFERLTSTINICDGKVHHVVGTWDGTTVKLYIDGRLNGSVSFSGSIKQSASPLQFGKSQHASAFSYFTGLINNVFVYERALSESEVTQLYTNPYQMFIGYVP